MDEEDEASARWKKQLISLWGAKKSKQCMEDEPWLKQQVNVETP